MGKIVLYILLLTYSNCFSQSTISIDNIKSFTLKTFGNPANPNLYMDTGKILFSSKKTHIYWFDNQSDGLYWKGGSLLHLGATNGVDASIIAISPLLVSFVHSGSNNPQKILVPFSGNLNTQLPSYIMVMENDTVKTITVQQLINMINQQQYLKPSAITKK